MYRVEIIGTGTRYACAAGQDLLCAMEQQGVRGIPVGCRRGGCGACKVQIVEGRYDSLKMSAAQVGEQDKAAGYALACRVLPRSDIRLRLAAAPTAL